MITTLTANSRQQNQCEACRSTISNYRVNFYYPVPPATYDRDTWMEWLVDRIEETEMHESREFVRLEWTSLGPDGEMSHVEYPVSPNHGPGRDPGRRYAYATDTQRKTSFRGVVGAG